MRGRLSCAAPHPAWRSGFQPRPRGGGVGMQSRGTLDQRSSSSRASSERSAKRQRPPWGAPVAARRSPGFSTSASRSSLSARPRPKGWPTEAKQGLAGGVEKDNSDDGLRRASSASWSRSLASSGRSTESVRTGVKVFVRVRPMSAMEVERVDTEVVVTDAMCGDSLRLVPQTARHAGPSKRPAAKTQPFTFDSVLSNAADQAFAYQVIGQPVLEGIIDGFHGCIFAYGQTGSGKSHTMFGGSRKERGLVPRIGEGLFRDLEGSGSNWIAKISYIEIYNEKIRDLLRPPTGPGSKPVSLEVRTHPKLGVFIEGLSKSIVRSVDDITRLLDYGHKLRVVGCTNMNAVSSRSHAIVTMQVERFVVIGPTEYQRVRRRAQLHCVDLAGSERGKDIGLGEERQKESNNINRSLWALSLLISTLAQNQERSDRSSSASTTSASSHIPFRNSKLTHLLSESLMGNCRTAMVACVAPNSGSLGMTESTIRFAQSVKKIKTRPVLNEDVEGDLVKSLRAEIEQLKQLLAQSSTDKKEAIESKIRATVELHQEFATSLEEQELCHRNMETARRRSLEGMGQLLSCSTLCRSPSLSSSDRDLPLEGLGPYLANICDDPLLSGRLQYALPPGKVVAIGSDDHCTIRIEGLGVQPQMCTLYCCQNGEVDVHISEIYPPAKKDAGLTTGSPRSNSTTPRAARTPSKRLAAGALYKSGIAEVTINDKAIQAQHRLKHGDILRVGRTHAFRFIVPEQSACEVTDIVSNLTCSPKEEMLALEFAEHLEERIGSDRAVKVLRKMQEIEPLISEMNDITEELRGGESRDLMFKAHVLIDVTADDDDPELMVALHSVYRPDDISEISNAPLGFSGCPRSRLEAVWSVENFRRRLEVARDVHLEVSERPEQWGLPTDLDPWRGEAIVPHVSDVLDANRIAEVFTPISCVAPLSPADKGDSPVGSVSLALPIVETVSTGVETDIRFHDMIFDTDVGLVDVEIRKRLLDKMMPRVETKLAEAQAELASKEGQLGQITGMREELQRLHAEKAASMQKDSTSARLHMVDVEQLQAELAKRNDEIAKRDEVIAELQAKHLPASSRILPIEPDVGNMQQPGAPHDAPAAWVSPPVHQQQVHQLPAPRCVHTPTQVVRRLSRPQTVPSMAQSGPLTRVDSRTELFMPHPLPASASNCVASAPAAAPPAPRSSRTVPGPQDPTPASRVTLAAQMAGLASTSLQRTTLPPQHTSRSPRESSPYRSVSAGAACAAHPASASVPRLRITVMPSPVTRSRQVYSPSESSPSLARRPQIPHPPYPVTGSPPPADRNMPLAEPTANLPSVSPGSAAAASAAAHAAHAAMLQMPMPQGQAQDQVQRHIYAEIERLRVELQGLSELCRTFKFS